MEIEDDGKGFDPDANRRADAFGIVGMYERAALIKGNVTVDSHPGRGTRISVSVPRTTDQSLSWTKYRQPVASVAGGLSIGVGGNR
jgi:nitrate/nitrite-specific signal transduction histidine kinase